MHGLKVMQQKIGEGLGRYEKTEVEPEYLELEQLTRLTEKATDKTVRELYPRGSISVSSAKAGRENLERRGDSLVKTGDLLKKADSQKSVFGDALITLGEALSDVGALQAQLDSRLIENSALGHLKTFHETDIRDARKLAERCEEARLQYDRVRREQTKKKKGPNDEKLRKVEQHYLDIKQEYLLKMKDIKQQSGQLSSNLREYAEACMEFHQQAIELYRKAAKRLAECENMVDKSKRMSPPPGGDFSSPSKDELRRSAPLIDVGTSSNHSTPPTSNGPSLTSSMGKTPPSPRNSMHGSQISARPVSPRASLTVSDPSVVSSPSSPRGMQPQPMPQMQQMPPMQQMPTAPTHQSMPQMQQMPPQMQQMPQMPPMQPQPMPQMQDMGSPMQQHHQHQQQQQHPLPQVPPKMPQRLPPTPSFPRCEAMYDYNAQEPGELTFRRGDVIAVVGGLDQDWWNGELRGVVGQFPSNFVKLMT